jgi:predicted nucleic acid-binding protein
LLDTNVLVHLVRGDAVWARVRSTYRPLLLDSRPIISVVAEGELRSLALQFNWKAEKIDQMEFYLGYLQRVSIDDPRSFGPTPSLMPTANVPANRSARMTSGLPPRLR